jgi:hypothetical protein
VTDPSTWFVIRDVVAATGVELRPLDSVTCRYCGATGAIRLDWRTEVEPAGSSSPAGGTPTYAAVPWAVCVPGLGGCGHESRGERTGPGTSPG